MVWKTETFIKASFLWMGRSMIPPFNIDNELGNKWREIIEILWSIASGLVSYATGAAFLQQAHDDCPGVLHFMLF